MSTVLRTASSGNGQVALVAAEDLDTRIALIQALNPLGQGRGFQPASFVLVPTGCQTVPTSPASTTVTGNRQHSARYGHPSPR